MSYDYTPAVLVERIRREGLLYVVLDFDGDAIEPLEALIVDALAALAASEQESAP